MKCSACGCRCGVTIGKNERGSWCVYLDGRIVSDHATRDGAVAAANSHRHAKAYGYLPGGSR